MIEEPDEIDEIQLELDALRERIREAFKRYRRSEGCSCCQNMEAHKEAEDELGELLGFKRYSDDSGYDFYENPKPLDQ